MTVALPTPTTKHSPDQPVPGPGCDCARCDFFTDNPTAREPVCSGCNSACAYCGCAHAEDPTRAVEARKAACRGCPIRCPSRVDMASWIADVGGTVRFDDIWIPGRVPSLPAFTPQIDGSDLAVLDESLSWPAYAIGLRRVLSPHTGRIMPKFAGRTAHEALGLAEDRVAILVGYGTDPLVEAYWTRRRVDHLAEMLRNQKWDLVLAPNTSMFLNQPRTEHLINFRRNLMMAAELAAAGVTAVPNVYWARLEDLERYRVWIDDVYPAGLPAIAINLQTLRDTVDWEQLALPGLTWLAATLPADLPMIVVGVSRADRLATVTRLFGSRVRVIGQHAAQCAAHGVRLTATGRVTDHARTGDLFAANVRYYADLMNHS